MTASPAFPASPRSRPGGPLRFLFPRGVKLWHFVILPTIAMAALIVASRWAGVAAEPVLNDDSEYVFRIVRLFAIAAAMSSLIGWLAVHYHRAYERELEARNIQLEATRDFLAGIIAASGEGIITRDLDGRVTSWNPAAERIYGWSAAEMLGGTIERLMTPEERAARVNAEARVRQGETVRLFGAERSHKDGRTIQVDVTMSPLFSADGATRGTMGIVQDVTELRETQRELREKATLAAVGQLAATVAHEIKNPLAGIRGACEIVVDAFPPTDPKRELTEEVLRQVDRLNRTVHELLVFARPRAAQKVPTDIRLVIDRVLGVLREDPQNRDVAFERMYPDKLPLVQVDPGQMEQVLFNVVLNAIQASDHRGTVHVRTSAQDGTLRVTVRDHGPGISPEIAERLFEPFATTKAKGSGLGLAVVRNIVAGHGGTIHAENAEGGGAQFTLELPLEGEPR